MTVIGPYFVISEFKHRGQSIKPPGVWTPLTQESADRLVAAKCLKPIDPDNGSDLRKLRRLLDAESAEFTKPDDESPPVVDDAPAVAESPEQTGQETSLSRRRGRGRKHRGK